jgi:hypothetical protein
MLATTLGAQAQSTGTASLSGKVVHPNNVTHAGERVLLYNYAAKTWIGPALTDDFGTYAFYGVAPGTYLLSLYGGGKPVWNTKVTIGSIPSRYDIQAPA